jgi:hypothetical protein
MGETQRAGRGLLARAAEVLHQFLVAVRILDQVKLCVFADWTLR